MTDLPAAVARNGFAALNRVVRPLVKRGLGSPPRVGVGAVVLSTTGRTSGETREVPLLGARFGNTVMVSTVRGNSQWLRNAEASPDVNVWLHGNERSGVAAVRRLPGLDVALVHLDPRQSRAARTRSSAA